MIDLFILFTFILLLLGDYTTTHVSADANHGEDKTVIPGFNIRKRDADAIVEIIQNNFIPIANFAGRQHDID